MPSCVNVITNIKYHKKRKSARNRKKYKEKKLNIIRKAAKDFFFIGPATKRGEGKVLATKKKELLFKVLKNIPPKNVATKLEGGGVWP